MYEIPDLSPYLNSYRGLEEQLAEETIQLDSAEPANLLVSFPEGTSEPLYNGVITCEYDELTAFCPWTDFPDQGKVKLTYQPDDKLLELKSFKYYMLAFRNMHITQEHLAQKMLHDLVNLLDPISLVVELDYMPRGGIHTKYTVSYPYVSQDD